MDDTSFFETVLLPLRRQQQTQSKTTASASTDERNRGHDSAAAAASYYDVIVYNFAVNMDKAVYAATTFLGPTRGNSRLLAPVNDRTDYWEKQRYVLLDQRGEIVWQSPPEVGAWSIQFQPDVTSPRCTGIWCGAHNGFFEQRQQQQKRQQ
jgi:hypothetical protein